MIAFIVCIALSAGLLTLWALLDAGGKRHSGYGLDSEDLPKTPPGGPAAGYISKSLDTPPDR